MQTTCVFLKKPASALWRLGRVQGCVSSSVFITGSEAIYQLSRAQDHACRLQTLEMNKHWTYLTSASHLCDLKMSIRQAVGSRIRPAW